MHSFEISYDSFCKQLQSVGKPINVFDGHIVCINNQSALLKTKDYLLGVDEKNNLTLFDIESLHINKEPVDSIDEENIDIGIGLKCYYSKAKKSLDYYAV